jgi:MoaA/NifB/PqqE/SkfB family radical SAM enzyme
MALEVDFDFTAKPCCKMKTVFGNILKTPVIEIFNGNSIKKIQKQMASGIRPVECTTCWEAESKQTTSLRQHMFKKFGKEFEQQYFDYPNLKVLQFVPNNTCNFSCRICNPIYSSKILAEELKYLADDAKKSITNIINLNKKNINVEMLANSCKDVEYLRILGGEPFLWTELPVLLEKIINQGYSKNIKIGFSSNGSIYPASLLPLLKQFNSTEILLSIDDLYDRFEIQRGGKWGEIYQNLILFKKLKSESKISVKISPTVNIQNLLYLDQLVDFCNQLDFEIVWCYLENPRMLCIDNVTQKVKDIVKEKYTNHTCAELQAIAIRVQQTQPYKNQDFISYMSKLDGRRKKDFQKSHKIIFDAMID